MAAFRLYSQFPCLEPRWGYGVLLWPLVKLKQIFEVVYLALLSLLWAEMTGKGQGSLQVGLFLGVFCALSLGVYYLRDYEAQLFMAFVIIWWLDRMLTRWRYSQGREMAAVELHCKGDRCLYALKPSVGLIQRQGFAATQIAQLTIAYEEAQGGVFQSILGTVWRVYIVLRDGHRLLFYEETTAIAALQRAQHLVRQFSPLEIPIRFHASEGETPYACDRPTDQLVDRYRRNRPKTLNLRPNASGWLLQIRRTPESIGLLLRELFQQSGFLLFVIAMTQVMELFGSLLHGSAITYRDPVANQIMLIDVLGTWDLNPDWPDLAEGAIAFGVLLSKAFSISQGKRLIIHRDRITLFLNHHPVSQIQTQQIQAMLILHEPHPLVVLLDQQRELLISGLQTPTESRGLWVTLLDILALPSLH